MVFKRLRAKLRRQGRRRGTGPGLLYSLLLHGAAVALILLWPGFENTRTPRMVALIVDLVDAPSSGSSASGEKAAETGANAAPAAAPASVPAAPVRREATPTPPAPKGEEPRPAQPAARQDAAPAIGDLLRGAEAAHGGAAPAPGPGGAGFADAMDAGGTGATSLKDFIRVQIERRWQVDPNAPNTQVSLRIVIAADGSITAAEPLNDGGQDRVLRALAIGARNAALLSSPLQFPRGTFAITGEMIIDLNTRDARR